VLKDLTMLPIKTFQTVVENAPLVSIDLCMVYEKKILLGLRSGEPLKNIWFTPGGRLKKNEPWELCLKRVAYDELGYKVNNVGNFHFMGLWDHLYPNSFFDENISTHYLNLPHYCQLKSEPNFKLDYQHKLLKWFDLEEVASNDSFHKYMRCYASWLINMGKNND
jgi:colanic acid biosynthesis protein WcaH